MVTKAENPRIHAGFRCQPRCDRKRDQGCDRRAKTRWAGGRLFSDGKTEPVTGEWSQARNLYFQGGKAYNERGTAFACWAGKEKPDACGTTASLRRRNTGCVSARSFGSDAERFAPSHGDRGARRGIRTYQPPGGRPCGAAVCSGRVSHRRPDLQRRGASPELPASPPAQRSAGPCAGPCGRMGRPVGEDRRLRLFGGRTPGPFRCRAVLTRGRSAGPPQCAGAGLSRRHGRGVCPPGQLLPADGKQRPRRPRSLYAGRQDHPVCAACFFMAHHGGWQRPGGKQPAAAFGPAQSGRALRSPFL